MEIRIVTPEDAAEVVQMANRIDTTSLQTAQTFRAMIERGAPEGTERLVAVVEGTIVGWAPSGMHGDGSGWFWVGVDAAYRRRGIGSAVYDRIEKRLAKRGASTLQTTIQDEDGRSFLEHRDFVRTNVMSMQVLDLEHTDLPESSLSTLPLSAVDVDSIRSLYQEGHADIPSASPRAPHEDADFRRQVVEAELVDREISSVVVEDGRPVAFTVVIANRDEGRASTQMTAVARDRRGRGLGYAVKVDSLRRARAAGLRTMLTSNDLENAPMLAVNRKLGFEASVLLESYEKELRGETASSRERPGPAP